MQCGQTKKVNQINASEEEQRVSNSLKRDCMEAALPQIIEKRAVYNTCEKPESATRRNFPNMVLEIKRCVMHTVCPAKESERPRTTLTAYVQNTHEK